MSFPLPFAIVSAGFAAIMIPALLLQLWLGWSWGGRSVEAQQPGFNNPPGVDIWCGKAYRTTNSSFDPGGQLFPPKDIPSTPNGYMYLDLRIYPQKSLYLPSDGNATFIVDSVLNMKHGGLWKNQTIPKEGEGQIPFTDLRVQLFVLFEGAHETVEIARTHVPVNSTGNRLSVSLDQFPARKESYSIVALGGDEPMLQSFQANPTLTVLPERNSTGSIARVDNLHSTIEVKSSITNNTWTPLFPFSFYTSWDWISSTINNASAPKNLSTFKDLGYNLIHPIPPGGNDPFDPEVFEDFLNICDGLGLWVMYDMRHTYQNNTSIDVQLARLQAHPSLLLYYTADEPDGSGDPLTATRSSYSHIKKVDPYHPVSLVLNCENFYFDAYTRGAADIILEDVYPIAANTTFSPVYHTVCNSTYGDCGCDNCHAYDPAYPAYVENRFLDIPTRIRQYYQYQEWLNYDYKRPVWGVPQAFYDEGSFWARKTTPEEEIVMDLLSVNHGAKGLVAWSYPTSTELEEVTGAFARQVIAQPAVTSFWFGDAERVALKYTGTKEGFIDAVAWKRGNELLVSIASVRDEAILGPIFITLGSENATVRVDYTNVYWKHLADWQPTFKGQLIANRLEPLGTWVGKVTLS